MRNTPQCGNLSAAGMVPRRSYRAPKGGNAQPIRTDLTSSPLSTIFPTTRMMGPVGFQSIKIPLAFQTTFGLAQAANAPAILLHSLCDLEPAAIFGAECSLYGALIHLNSTSKTGAADRPNEVLWGIPVGTLNINQSTFANNAALIAIGDERALPRGPDAHNRWSFMPPGSFNVPGFADPTVV